jgi:hypothetical protein
LQEILRDYLGVQKPTLNGAIREAKSKMPSLEGAFYELCRREKVQANMDQDVNLILEVEPDEADNLIWVVESLLRNWYRAGHQT